MKRLILFLLIISTTLKCCPQLLDNSLFRIYRAEFISGSVTQLKLDRDSAYHMSIAEIHCSLCDHEMLNRTINSNGKWTQYGDTIYLYPKPNKHIKLLIINDSILSPLYPIGIDLDLMQETRRQQVLQSYLSNTKRYSHQEFHLIYDTYSNGVARLIIDKYRMRRNEYEIHIKEDGSIIDVKYFWDDKQRTRIR